MADTIEKVREVLGQIVNHRAISYDAHGLAGSDGDRRYQIGLTDGHRCAAMFAREALALLEGYEVVEFDVYEEGMPGNRLIEIPCARPALLLIKKEANDE